MEQSEYQGMICRFYRNNPMICSHVSNHLKTKFTYNLLSHLRANVRILKMLIQKHLNYLDLMSNHLSTKVEIGYMNDMQIVKSCYAAGYTSCVPMIHMMCE